MSDHFKSTSKGMDPRTLLIQTKYCSNTETVVHVLDDNNGYLMRGKIQNYPNKYKEGYPKYYR